MRAHGAGDLPGRYRGRPGGPDLLQPVQSDLSAWRLHLRRRHRSGHVQVKVRRFVAVDDCGTGSTHDHRGAGPRRAYRRRRHGADGDDRLRRGRQLPRRVPDGLPDPDRARGARLGDRLHRHPVAAPSDRRQGRRRGRHGRLAGPRRSSTRSWTRSSRSAYGTPTCRSPRPGSGTRCAAGRGRRSEAGNDRDRRAGPDR